MKFISPLNLADTAAFINAKIIGSDVNSGIITGINEIHKVENGDITFVDHPKYYDKALSSAATFIIINKETEAPPGKVLLVCNDPFSAYNKIVNHYFPFSPSSKHISDSAVIGKGTVLQPGVFVGNQVCIGKKCIIHSNVSIYDHSIIGDNVIIHANTVIGSDAFYFKRRETHYEKMYSCGRVIIEDNVEIGACCTIDRGVSGDTIIGKGSKLDNHIHIGHDTVTGENCLFAAQVGIAGVATIEDNVILWGQVGVNKDLVIGKGAVVYAQSGVAKSIEAGKAFFGSPAVEAREKMKEIAYVKRIPELIEMLKD